MLQSLTLILRAYNLFDMAYRSIHLLPSIITFSLIYIRLSL